MADQTTPLYRIAWRARLTGATGHGTGLFTRAEAERIAADLNASKGTPDDTLCHHWAEPAEETKPDDHR